MSILTTISHYAHEFSAARTRYLTERAISSLPIELQKDIGWPVESPRTHDTHGAGSWAGGK